MGFFKRHQGRSSYDLFSNYSYFLPGLKGMFMLLAMFLIGSLLGNLAVAILTLTMSSQFAMEYGTVISYPLMFVPPMLYASYQSRKNEFSAWAEDGSQLAGIPVDSNNFGRLGGWWLALIASVATIAAAFIAEPVNALLPEMPEILKKGLGKLILNEDAIRADLERNWAVVAEAIQTILRRENYPNPYETLKALTRTGAGINHDVIADFIETLEVNESVKEELRAITPWTYTGF